MPQLDFPYTPMPGRLRGFVRKSSLWEGPDYLLLVRGTRFSEEYRRFYYREIEAIVVQNCARAGSFGWWLVSVIAVAGVMGVAAAKSPLGLIGGAGAIALCLLVIARLIVAICYSCRCFIQTRVSREELPSLMRRWTADKALARLRIRIKEAQGALPVNASLPIVSVEPDVTAETTAGLETPPALSAASAARKKESAVRSVNLALVAFALLLVDAVQMVGFVEGPKPVLNSNWMRALTTFLLVCIGGATVSSLLSSNDLRSLRNLRKWLVATLIFESLDMGLSRILGSFYTLDKGVVNISLTALRGWQWLVSIDGGLCVLLGCGGLLFVLMNWETLRRGDVSAA